QRVAAGVVDPVVHDRRLAGRVRSRGVAQPAARGAGRLVVRLIAGGPDVDRGVARAPGGGLQVERLDGGEGLVEFRRRPSGDGGGGTAEVQHEDLLSWQAADRGEIPLDEVQRPAVAQLLVVHPGGVRPYPGELVVPGD